MSRPRRLKPDQVREIRKAWRPQPSIASLARKFGVNPTSISRVIRWESYKDIRGA